MNKKIILIAFTALLTFSGIITITTIYKANPALLSADEISDKALNYVKGKVYKIEYFDEGKSPFYEVTIQNTAAEKYELKLDAKNGDLLNKQQVYENDKTEKQQVLAISEVKKRALMKINGTIEEIQLDRTNERYIVSIQVSGKAQLVFVNMYTGETTTKEKTKAKISKEEAKEIATEQISGEIVNVNFTNGMYAIEIVQGNKKHEIQIDQTGNIVTKKLKETQEKQSTEETQPESVEEKQANLSYISEQKAHEIVLAQVAGTIISSNFNEVQKTYTIKVRSDDETVWTLTINAETGAILNKSAEKIEQEDEPTLADEEGTQDSIVEDEILDENQVAQSVMISKEEASKIALSQVSGTVTKIELEKNIYDIEIKDGTYEYEVEIEASTGAILSVEKEYEE